MWKDGNGPSWQGRPERFSRRLLSAVQAGVRWRVLATRLLCCKEQQLDLFADRTSTATLRANQLRLYWALFAAALLEILRQRGLAGTELARAQFGTIRERLLK